MLWVLLVAWTHQHYGLSIFLDKIHFITLDIQYQNLVIFVFYETKCLWKNTSNDWIIAQLFVLMDLLQYLQRNHYKIMPGYNDYKQWWRRRGTYMFSVIQVQPLADKSNSSLHIINIFLKKYMFSEIHYGRTNSQGSSNLWDSR